jgi:cell division protein FtsL
MKARFLKYWVIVVIAISLAFGVQLLVSSEILRTNYQLEKEKKKEAELRMLKKALVLEVATLSQHSRIEAVGRGVLGMDHPKRDQVVIMHEQHATGGIR